MTMPKSVKYDSGVERKMRELPHSRLIASQLLETSHKMNSSVSARCVEKKMDETADLTKRPMTAENEYNRFLRDAYVRSIKVYGHVNFQDFKAMGLRGKSTNEEERNVYQEKTSKYQERHSNEKLAYDEWVKLMEERVEEREQEEVMNGKKNVKEIKKVQTSPPKPSLSAYDFFFKEECHEKEHCKTPLKELIETTRSKWKSFNEEDKEFYKEKAKKDLVRYSNEMKAFNKWRNSIDAYLSLKERGTTHFERTKMERV
jgi:hypothetical protein